MTFKRRLRYYLIGFGMGLLLCIALFGTRGCDWTPGNRVLKQIATSQILITDSVRCVLKANKISDDDIFQVLNNGDVLFSESKVHQVPKEYIIEEANGKFKLHFLVRNDSVSLVYGVADGKKVSCGGFGENPEHILAMPEETVKRVLTTNKEFAALDSVVTKLKNKGVEYFDVAKMIQSGKIDFTQSTPTLKPHPIYYVDYKKYHFIIEMSEKHTRIVDFWMK